MENKLKGVQVITPENVEQIKRQLEDGKCYWVKYYEEDTYFPLYWEDNVFQAFGSRDEYLLQDHYSIDLTPIVPQEPISDEEIEKMAEEKYPMPYPNNINSANDRCRNKRKGYIQGAKDLRKKIYEK